jgi:hypothetical protein
VRLDGSLPTDDQVDQLIPADEREPVMAEQEANQERVAVYPPWTRPRRWWPRCRTCRSPTWPPDRSSCPPTWPAKRMQAFIAAKQVQFTKAIPQGRLVEVQSPMPSTWSSRSS